MSEDINLEELSREVDDLRERVNFQRTCLEFLSIIVFFLLARIFIIDPYGSFYILIFGVVIIPIFLVLSRLEQRGL